MLNSGSKTLQLQNIEDETIDIAFRADTLPMLTNTVTLYNTIQELTEDQLDTFLVDDGICNLLGIPVGTTGKVLKQVNVIPMKDINGNVEIIPISEVKLALVKAQLTAGGFSLNG